MKNLCLITSLLILHLAIIAQGTWHHIGELPVSTTTPTDIHFFSDSFGMALSRTGTFRTTDGGYNWIKIDSRGGGDIAFRTPEQGLIITDRNSSATHLSDYNLSVDSGKTWSVPYIYLDHPMYASRGQFISPDTGYIMVKSKPAAIRKTKIYKTTDGSSSWLLSLDSSEMTDLHELVFVNDSIGFASGLMTDTIPAVIYTNNGGQSWTSKPIESVEFRIKDIEAVDKNISFLVSEFGKKLYKTEDAWDNANEVFTDTVYQKVLVKFPSSNRGYCIAVNTHTTQAEIFTSFDLGETWVFEDTLPANFNAVEMFFLHDTLGWIIGTDRRVVSNMSFVSDTSNTPVDTSDPGDTTTTIQTILNDEGITVYPNPGHDKIIIKTSFTDTYEMMIRDLQGKIIYRKTNNIHQQEVSTHGWPAGIYYIVVTPLNSQRLVKKLIVN